MRHEVVRCATDNWFTAYIPFKPTDREVDACVRVLSNTYKRHGERKKRGPLLKAGKFVAFSQLPSKRTGVSEKKVFAPIQAIVERIMTVNLDDANRTETSSPCPASSGSPGGEHPTSHQRSPATVPTNQDQGAIHALSDKDRRHATALWGYASPPNRAIPGEQAGSTNRADGIFYRRSSQLENLSLAEVAFLCEYKKEEAEAVKVGHYKAQSCSPFTDLRYDRTANNLSLEHLIC